MKVTAVKVWRCHPGPSRPEAGSQRLSAESLSGNHPLLKRVNSLKVTATTQGWPHPLTSQEEGTDRPGPWHKGENSAGPAQLQSSPGNGSPLLWPHHSPTPPASSFPVRHGPHRHLPVHFLEISTSKPASWDLNPGRCWTQKSKTKRNTYV